VELLCTAVESQSHVRAEAAHAGVQQCEHGHDVSLRQADGRPTNVMRGHDAAFERNRQEVSPGVDGEQLVLEDAGVHEVLCEPADDDSCLEDLPGEVMGDSLPANQV
jgi:hypothetical protein